MANKQFDRDIYDDDYYSIETYDDDYYPDRDPGDENDNKED